MNELESAMVGSAGRRSEIFTITAGRGRGEAGDTPDQDSGTAPPRTVLGTVVAALTTSPVSDPFTVRSLALGLVSCALYLVDYCSDMMVAYWLNKEDGPQVPYWRAWTILLIVAPLILVNLFSIVWHHEVRVE